MILRSTGKVKRGLGTIRQDVNVSIKGHPRVEIKGFQDLKSMLKVIEIEVGRQQKEKKGESHVRKVNPDFSTEFMRPMPGAARMYPETDVIPLKPDVKSLKEGLPELIDEKEKRYEKLGLSKDLATALSKSNKTEMFDNFVKKFKKIKPSFLASTLVSTTREIQRKYEANMDKLTEKEFEDIFEALNNNIINKNVIIDILIDYAQDKFESFEHYKGASTDNLEKEIEEIVKAKPGLSPGAYMGIIMGKYQGKVDGKQVMDILKKLIK
jgi:glutamyl-tRNA(Gln) amidotransferase subunit E